MDTIDMIDDGEEVEKIQEYIELADEKVRLREWPLDIPFPFITQFETTNLGKKCIWFDLNQMDMKVFGDFRLTYFHVPFHGAIHPSYVKITDSMACSELASRVLSEFAVPPFPMYTPPFFLLLSAAPYKDAKYPESYLNDYAKLSPVSTTTNMLKFYIKMMYFLESTDVEKQTTETAEQFLARKANHKKRIEIAVEDLKKDIINARHHLIDEIDTSPKFKKLSKVRLNKSEQKFESDDALVSDIATLFFVYSLNLLRVYEKAISRIFGLSEYQYLFFATRIFKHFPPQELHTLEIKTLIRTTEIHLATEMNRIQRTEYEASRRLGHKMPPFIAQHSLTFLKKAKESSRMPETHLTRRFVIECFMILRAPDHSAKKVEKEKEEKEDEIKVEELLDFEYEELHSPTSSSSSACTSLSSLNLKDDDEVTDLF